jgi:ACS family glucarate transporter-like MFS transporter
MISRPTGVRHAVLAMTTIMAVLLYLDRVCISAAGSKISSTLKLSKEEMGVIYGAFFLAYAFGQVPAGWLGDRLGARRMLVFCVVAWSLLTALTGLASAFISLLLLRLFFGLAQAGAYPIAAKVNSLWIPFHNRGQANSFISLGGRAGGAIAPALTAILIGLWDDWRPVFGVFALPGLVWAIAFWLWYRDTPEEHPDCNNAEVDLIARQPPGVTNPAGPAGAVPWDQALRSRGLWMQCFAQFTTNIPWILLITWLPTYLEETYHITPEQSGILSSFPLMVGMVGCGMGGVATDRLTRRLGLKWGRNLPGMTTKFIAAAGPLFALSADHPALAVAALSLSAFMVDLGLGATWAYFQDAGGPHVGTFLGWANMFGNLGAFLSPICLGWLAKAHGWPAVLATCAVLYVLSGLCWLGIDARVPIVQKPA